MKEKERARSGKDATKIVRRGVYARLRHGVRALRVRSLATRCDGNGVPFPTHVRRLPRVLGTTTWRVGVIGSVPTYLHACAIAGLVRTGGKQTRTGEHDRIAHVGGRARKRKMVLRVSIQRKNPCRGGAHITTQTQAQFFILNKTHSHRHDPHYLYACTADTRHYLLPREK